VCNAKECKKYELIQCTGILIQYAGVLTKQTSSLQYQDMNCYFASLDFMVQNDYEFEVACMMNILTRL